MSPFRRLLASYKLVPFLLGLLILLSMGDVGTPMIAWSQQAGVNPAAQSAVGTAFTYQGRLSNNSNGAVTGQYDFQFTLYDAESGGTVVGDAQTKSNVGVSNGVFTVHLDFGPGAFTGAPRWLALGVRPASTGEFETLAPRQPLTPVPYAIYADTTNLNTVQARVSSTCADGSSIRVINGDGTVTCEPDDVGSSGGNTHDHLGQTWTANGNPLTIQGVLNGDANAPLILNNTGTGHGLIVKSEGTLGNAGVLIESNVNNGVSAIVQDANAIDIVSTGRYATIYAESRGSGSTIYATNTFTGNGVVADVGPANGFQAYSNHKTFATAYLENGGAGSAVTALSKSGAAGWFETDTGENIIVAYDTLSSTSADLRFKVTRAGNVNADGTFASPAADFAELLPAQPGLEPGDVLVVSATGELARSTATNATNVAGVYSTKPGFLGGAGVQGVSAVSSVGETNLERGTAAKQAGSTNRNQRADSVEGGPPSSSVAETTVPDSSTTASTESAANKIPLALLGVVPVKVTAENGPIQPGDLLTTSSTPGHAMKASPVNLAGIELYRPGTIIGKALEPWADGAGMIQVLIVLQ